MSARQEKLTRREIRRAFGPEAVTAIAQLDDKLTDLRSKVVALDHAAGRKFKTLDTRLNTLEKLADLGLLGRLRWLLTGVVR